MFQFSERMQADFENEFGPRCSLYAQGMKDCRENKGKQSNDPKYLAGFVRQVNILSEQANKSG